jgi:hypothetical protein
LHLFFLLGILLLKNFHSFSPPSISHPPIPLNPSSPISPTFYFVEFFLGKISPLFRTRPFLPQLNLPLG